MTDDYSEQRCGLKDAWSWFPPWIPIACSPAVAASSCSRAAYGTKNTCEEKIWVDNLAAGRVYIYIHGLNTKQAQIVGSTRVNSVLRCRALTGRVHFMWGGCHASVLRVCVCVLNYASKKTSKSSLQTRHVRCLWTALNHES